MVRILACIKSPVFQLNLQNFHRFVVAFFADLLAFVGAHKGQPCLLSFWLVIGLVNIAGYFLLWALIPTLIYASHLTDQPFFRATRVIRKMFDGNWYISGNCPITMLTVRLWVHNTLG